ncbi:MAG: aspartate kinase [Bacteroidales bacterium]|nr:aspartate kinase [Bacteroidales bacterium]
MQIYKFGGSVLQEAYGIHRMAEALQQAGRPLVVVVSAFGKTTNALEELANLSVLENRQEEIFRKTEKLNEYHVGILTTLWGNAGVHVPGYNRLENLFSELTQLLTTGPGSSFDSWHDLIVSFGERLSSSVVYSYLKKKFPDIVYRDIREIIVTDSRFGSAGVLWEETVRRVRQAFSASENLFLTQGYIAGTPNKETTTLGREGSDFTAAILGSILDAEKVILWKDVPGVMNADPKICTDAVRLPGISYQEAAEMAFYGAKVIHPKTIKPLQNKHIPLVVRGLEYPDNMGTTIWDFEEMERHVPVYIRKKRQILLSVFPRDYSFVLNRHLEDLFGQFKQWVFNISLVQISAISVSFCIDDPGVLFMERVRKLQDDYEVYFNRDAELLTFRHYTEKTINEKLQSCLILVSQRTRLTAQYVVKRVAGE